MPADAKPSDLLSFGRPDQGRAHRFGHSEEDHYGVGGELGGLRFGRDFAESCFRVVPAVANPGIAGGIESDWRNYLQTADVALGWGNRIAGFQPRWAGLGAHAAQLGHGMAGGARHPDVVIAVDGNPPWAGDGAARVEGAVHRPVRADHRHIAAGVFADNVPQIDPHVGCQFVSRHRPFQRLSLAFELLLDQSYFLHRARMPNEVADPGVALAVDCNSMRAKADLDLLGPSGVAGRRAGHGVGAAVGDPDPVLLVDGDTEGPLDLKRAIDRLAVHGSAENAALYHSVFHCPPIWSGHLLNHHSYQIPAS